MPSSGRFRALAVASYPSLEAMSSALADQLHPILPPDREQPAHSQ